jgi:hypothetical protein
MFCPRHKENCAGEAGTSTAADSKRSLGGWMSGPVAEPTARRRLIKPGWDNAVRTPQQAVPDLTSLSGSWKSATVIAAHAGRDSSHQPLLNPVR